jgi:hypothetical protein
MIDKTLVFLVDQINAYLKKISGLENKLNLSNITNNEGKTIIKDLGLTLVNITEETIGKAQVQYRKQDNNSIYSVNPELKLNLFLLFTANFGDNDSSYRESLKFLSYIIQFFQAKNVFHHKNSPELDERIDKLILEIYSLSFEQQNYIWGSMGAKYLPSVMYKVRLLTIQEDETKSEVYPIQAANLVNP